MHKDCSKGKELVPKGQSKTDECESMKEAAKKAQVEKKCQDTIDFPSTNKKTKLEDSTGLTVVKVENKHDNQVVVKRDFLS